MAYRSFSTGTWIDPWFEKLNPSEKLLFIYLWTNDVCNQAGCYQISLRRIEFETGLKPEKILKSLSPKVEWYPEYNIVWIKNFFRRQCANEKFAIAGIRSLNSIPKEIVELFSQYNSILLEKYGIDTVSIPYSSEVLRVCESVTDQLQIQNQIQYTASGKGMSGFREFWDCYPKKVGKQEAMKAWSRQNGNRPELSKIISKLEEMKKSEQWTKDRGTFIPHPAKWLNRGGWEDEIKTNISREIKYNSPETDQERIYGKS
jgi:hypothetical protein